MLSRGELRSRPVPVFNPGTRHRRDPSPPLSCSIASFRLWPLAIIPQRRDVRRQASGVKRRDSAHTVNAVTTTHCRASRKTESHCRSPARPKPLTIGNGDSYHASALHPTLAASSDGPPALVAHSPCRASPALFGRDAVKARDALLGQCPLGQPRGVRRRGYSPTDTAHEMRIPLRPLRMSKPYRRLRKRRLRSESVKALLEMIVPTVSPSSET